MNEPSPFERTTIGTVIRKEWSKDYYQRVLSLEKKMRRPICGALTKSNFPCKNSPKKIAGYFCKIHKSSDTKTDLTDLTQGNNPSAVSTGVTNTLEVQQVHKHSDILKKFHKCYLCYLRTECDSFRATPENSDEPNPHCQIEEDIFYTFIDTVRQDYQLSQIDIYMVNTAAIMYAKAFYMQMIQGDYHALSDESQDVMMATIRLTKEFRESVKALGLTRHQRNQAYQRDMKIGVDAVQAQQQANLSQLMSEAALKIQQDKEKNKVVIDIETVEDHI